MKPKQTEELKHAEDEQISELTRKLRQLRREKVALQKQLNKEKHENEQLRSIIAKQDEEHTHTISMFEREKVALEQQLMECEDEKEALTIQYQKLAQAHGSLRDTASASVEKYNAMTEQQKEMTHTISMFEREKVTWQQQLQTLQQKSQKIEDEKEALAIKNQKLMEAYGTLR